ncbi:NTP transferase domain-containing protein [Kocuria sp.]|uniref:molybdenum cofactor guanylyltransferase n=1 Tax=Kocuria sp. TaxID=1871328 RepID=UPI00289DF0BC|nr:NTP transferase domain-containing protein [Kocuria sp.]
MRFDSVIVAGGRSSRLGGTPKAALRRGTESLVEITVRAVGAAGSAVVVGPDDLNVPAGTLQTREDPPFSGPAAAIAAGLDLLGRQPSRAAWTAVLACDMPDVSGAVHTLADAARGLPEDADGVIATATDGHRENLAVLIRTEPLTAVFSQHPARDRSVRSFWKHLRLIEVRAPGGSTQDVDTWEDVSRFDLH